MKATILALAAISLAAGAAQAQGQAACHYDTFSRTTVCDRAGGAQGSNPWARRGPPATGPAGSYYANGAHPVVAPAPSPSQGAPAPQPVGGAKSLYYLSQGVNLQAPTKPPPHKRRCFRNVLLAIDTCH